ncbi:alpha/beta hydrolase [Microbacterium hominis]|uniref:Alpha/beta hydrolase n=1 Tax=Microbacterium hominis TaxID=162426 RepID=A0A7D4TGJ6_9MICO|nr:alpha/beta hydrolase [Microbacterium hominis]QKJ20200.1 alpha/beta hydrolase [Microbacterium hominis]
MSRHRSLPAAARVVMVAVLAVAGILPASAASADTADTPEPVVRAECPVEIPARHIDRVECGVLTVPERRSDGADPARTIALPYAVISSTSGTPQPDPVFIVSAPIDGVSTFDLLPHVLDDAQWATDTRPVVLLERRGAGLSDPALSCPELDVDAMISDGVLLTGAAAAARRVDGAAECYDRLVADGIDPAAYTSTAAAADVGELRTALGYEQWNLYSVGDGTRVAQAVMRDRSGGLRSVILDATSPLAVNVPEESPAAFAGAVDHLLLTCQNEPGCAEEYPDLDESLTTALADAAAEPLLLTVDGPGGIPVQVELDDRTLAEGLRTALADAATVRTLPFVIDQLADGNGSAALPLAQQLVDAAGERAHGLALSVACAEEVPFSDPAVAAENAAALPRAAALGDGSDVFAECAAWPVPASGAGASTAVESDIYALVTTGAFDPLSPASWGQAAAASLSEGDAALFSRLSHGAVWQSDVDDCAAAFARQFLQDPTTAPEASCLQTAPPVEFLTTAQIDPTPSVYLLTRDLGTNANPIQLGIAAVTLLILLGTLVYGLVVAVQPSLRRSGDIPGGTALSATAAAVFNLLFAAALVYLVTRIDPIVLSFGIPAGLWPMLLLPFAGLAATILLVVLLVRAWITDDGAVVHRVLLSVSAAGSLGFALWLLARGLLAL